MSSFLSVLVIFDDSSGLSSLKHLFSPFCVHDASHAFWRWSSRVEGWSLRTRNNSVVRITGRVNSLSTVNNRLAQRQVCLPWKLSMSKCFVTSIRTTRWSSISVCERVVRIDVIDQRNSRENELRKRFQSCCCSTDKIGRNGDLMLDVRCVSACHRIDDSGKSRCIILVAFCWCVDDMSRTRRFSSADR